MLWVDQEVQSSAFTHWLYHWLILWILDLYIVNVSWCRNCDGFLTSLHGYVTGTCSEVIFQRSLDVTDNQGCRTAVNLFGYNVNRCRYIDWLIQGKFQRSICTDFVRLILSLMVVAMETLSCWLILGHFCCLGNDKTFICCSILSQDSSWVILLVDCIRVNEESKQASYLH